LRVRLTPGAGLDRIDGVVDGTLVARVAARPVDGAANASLVELLARACGIPRSRVRIVRGTTARIKLVVLHGLDAGLVRSRWPGIEV
jgi:uncharacterized protein YggU (UPF0235/DUF167 family)